MEDSLKPQIQNSCRFALPEGLRELMSDISREVLRAQPNDLYKFIVDYLAAMLLARDTLSLACRVCNDLCHLTCQPFLEEELKKIGLGRDSLGMVKRIVLEHFHKSRVNEGSLMLKLLIEAKLDESMLPAVQRAVRTAFVRHHQTHLKDEHNNKSNEGGKAAQHTLRFYEEVYDDERNQDAQQIAARKIQAYYRGYLARRCLSDGFENEQTGSLTTATSKANSHARLSSVSLAGSFMKLPKYIPYSPLSMTFSELDHYEKEHKTIDYTKSSQHEGIKVDEGKVTFHEHILHEIKSGSLKEDEYIEENIAGDIKSEASSVDDLTEIGEFPLFKDIPAIIIDRGETNNYEYVVHNISESSITSN